MHEVSYFNSIAAYMYVVVHFCDQFKFYYIKKIYSITRELIFSISRSMPL